MHVASLPHESGGPLYSDLTMLPYLAVPLLLSVFAALRPDWRWLFWAGWTPNAIASAYFVYAISSSTI